MSIDVEKQIAYWRDSALEDDESLHNSGKIPGPGAPYA